MYNNPNLVMNNHAIFLPLECGLTFASDADVSELLYNYYLTQECAYPNDALMARLLQTKADLIRDRYNKIYETTQYEYNPIENYDMVEDGTEHVDSESKSHTSSDTRSNEFPMNSATERPVGHGTGEGDGSASGNSDKTHTLRRHGNIGVTTAQQMIQSERELIIDLLRLYCDEFSDYFMITI